MPIKVRCKECSAVFAVSDKAAGRAVKCKNCDARVAVPAAGGASGGQAAAKRKRPRPAEASFDMASDPDDMFGGLDLRRAEDRRQKVCPSCTKPVDDEDFECPHCGVNIQTGALSQEQKKKRSRKGPPPEEFYKVIWPNAWKFLMGHKGFVFKTGILWGLSATMVIVAAFVLNWYTRTRALELHESAKGDITITKDGVFLDLEDKEEAEYDGVKYTPGSAYLTNGKGSYPAPEVAAWFSPPTYFWVFIFLVFLLSFGGWAWTLCAKIIQLTLAKEKKIKRFQGDMYGNMTTGFTSIFWPIVLMYPVIWIPIAMYFSGAVETASLITFIAIFMVPYLIFLPLALVHMSQQYSYRAWLISWMAKDLINTLVPTLYVSAIFFALVLVVPLGIAVGVAMGWNQVSEFYMNQIEVPALSAISSYTIADADSTGSFMFLRLPLLFMIGILGGTLLCTLLAFPSIFMMRVFGLFGLYFRPDMDLCNEQAPLSPAGFGPRFLAVQVDMVLAALIMGVCIWGSGMVYGLVNTLYESETIASGAYWVALVGSISISLGFYFANWESGSGRATLGKWTFGMLVVQDDNTPMPFNLALKRFWASMISVVTLSGTFTMCAFTPNHKALHDTMTKTKVVWRGDENM